MSAGAYLIVAVTVVLGACIQGSLGFGLGMLGAPVLALVDTRLVPGPLLCSAIAVTLLVAWRERAALDLRGVRWAVVGRVPGTFAGALAVSAMPERGLAIVFALLMLGAVLLSLAGLRVEPSPRATLGAGAASGFMGTITSVGGPAMALLYQHERSARLRATLALFFLFGAVFSLLTLAVTGDVAGGELRLGLRLLPPSVVGFGLSSLAARWFDRRNTRAVILWLSGTASAVLLVRELVALM